MNRVEAEKVNDILEAIKGQIEKQVNEDYTKYKEQCLKDLDISLESKRNKVVKDVLDVIDVVVSNSEMSLEPVINIKIIKKILMKGDK